MCYSPTEKRTLKYTRPVMLTSAGSLLKMYCGSHAQKLSERSRLFASCVKTDTVSPEHLMRTYSTFSKSVSVGDCPSWGEWTWYSSTLEWIRSMVSTTMRWFWVESCLA